MLDAFVAAGHNFLDTADVYGDGASEQTLAPWLARRRDEVVVATKVRFTVSDPGGSGLAPERIVRACDASLRRLGIDVIDLYQVHAPDTDVALEDTLAALDGLVRAGKVRALGASNFPAWLLAWAVARPGPRGLLPLRLAAAAVLARRALDRDRDPALLPRRRARGPPVGPARRRLPHRPLRARRAAARRHAHRRRRGRPRGGAAPPRHRGQLPRRRRGARGRRRARGERRAGRDRLAAGPAGRHRADPRPAHARAARGPAARRRAGADRRAGRAARALHRPARSAIPSA